MELFRKKTSIDFMGLRRMTGVFSLLMCCFALVGLFSKGLNFGLEFTGGMQVEARFSEEVAPDEVRQSLENLGLEDARVQQYGSTHDLLIRVAGSKLNDEQNFQTVLSKHFADKGYNVEIRRIEYVGSEVGEELAEQGGLAVLVAILATMIYIAFRYEYRFAISAATALCHDALIVLGIFAWFGLEFDLATLAAILAVLGYSLNDTIVVFDRVRENFHRMRKETTTQVMNHSINQTLSRTIMTSLLTLFVVASLLFLGSESLFGFSLALFLGIIIGTYSSIYVAGALALSLGLSRSDLLPKPKTQDLDDLP